MDIIKKIDSHLLVKTKHISKKLHELCGIHHMNIAKNLLIISCSLIVICLGIYLVAMIKDLFMVIAILCTMIFAVKFSLFVWKILVINYLKTQKGTLNKSRIEILGPRFFSLVFGFVFLILDILRFQNSSNVIMLILSIIFSVGLHFILFSIAIYFGSIEPEPPSESKVKKICKRIQGWFESEPIPEPT
jgi:hypothetical protein